MHRELSKHYRIVLVASLLELCTIPLVTTVGLPRQKTLLGSPLGIWLLAMAGACTAIAANMLVGPLTGLSLGYFYAGLIITALIASCCATTTRTLRDDLVVVVLICGSTVLLWMVAGLQIGVKDTWLASVALISIVAGVISILRFLRSTGLHDIFAFTLTVVLFLVWLSTPIWLGKTLLHSPPWTIDILTEIHPLLALNGQLQTLGDWTHQPIAYKYLLNLGQDIPYSPADTVAWCVCFHGSIATVFVVLTNYGRMKNPVTTDHRV